MDARYEDGEMDIATAIGLFMGCMTVIVLVLMDGSFGIYLDKHAFIVIFGGAIQTPRPLEEAETLQEWVKLRDQDTPLIPHAQVGLN